MRQIKLNPLRSGSFATGTRPLPKGSLWDLVRGTTCRQTVFPLLTKEGCPPTCLDVFCREADGVVVLILKI